MPDDPEDLDDYDIDPAREQEGPLPSYVQGGEPPRSRIDFPVILAGIGVLAIAIMAVLFLVFRKPPQPDVTPRAPVATPPMVAATPTPAVALPSLEASDAFVRGIAQTLSSHPELAGWLARNALVRTLTVVVDNVANGETPRPHLEFLAPKQRFKAARRPPRQIVPDPAGFKGYDGFADVIGSVDANAAATAYRTIEPLFDEAYKELGHPEGGFRKGLDAAIQALAAVPVLREDVALVPHAIGFRYEDQALEKLTPAQKQFLRIGPRNVRIVQGKLKELASALAAAPPSP
ncbi:MAG: DUF3014 domain-containing protein [Vicinamibacterales bacterium]|jgi:hypothetical protein